MAVADHPIMNVRRPSGFIAPCLPSKAGQAPSGPLWVHEIKHDGYRLMVRRDGGQVRCFTRNGHDWADAVGPSGSGWRASCQSRAQTHQRGFAVVLIEFLPLRRTVP